MTYHTSKESGTQRTRSPFTKEEDENLMRCVSYFGEDCWRVVALNMNGRSAKQCKDRYFNSLAPNLVNGKWSAEEEELLVEKVLELGTKWSHISKYFTNRGPNNLKNHWNRVIQKKGLEISPQPVDKFDAFQLEVDSVGFHLDNDWAGLDSLLE